MRILALDAATRTGWAYSDRENGDAPIYGALDLAAGLGRKPSQGSRFAAARGAFGRLIRALDPTVLLLERPFARGVTATRFLYGLAAVAEGLAHEHGIAFLDLDAKSVRKRLLGNGSATKEDVVAWARATGLGVTDEQGDEADALALLTVGLRAIRETPASVARRRRHEGRVPQ